MKMIHNYEIPILDRSSRTCGGTIIPRSIWARFAKWLLRKTRHTVVSEHYYTAVNYCSIDTSDINNLLKSILRENDLRRIMRGEIDRVIVGHDMYSKILDKLNVPMTINHGVEIGLDTTVRIYGVRIQLLPNVQGFLVVPKL